MTYALEDALDYGQRVQKEKASPQMGLFDMGGETAAAPSINVPALPAIEEWDEKHRLTLEKESLGFYITGHPLGRYEKVLERFTDADAITLKEQSDGAAVRIGGIITAVKTIRTKKGDPMAFITTEDRVGSIETTVFTSVYQAVSDLLTEDNAVLIEGQVQKDENYVKILADKIIPVEKAVETWTDKIHIKLDLPATDRTMLEKLRAVLQSHPGPCQGVLHLRNPETVEAVIELPESLQIAAGDGLTRAVNDLLGYDAVETACRAAACDGGLRKGRRFNGNGRRGYASSG